MARAWVHRQSGLARQLNRFAHAGEVCVRAFAPLLPTLGVRGGARIRHVALELHVLRPCDLLREFKRRKRKRTSSLEKVYVPQKLAMRGSP